jgi:hypothetical protein
VIPRLAGDAAPINIRFHLAPTELIPFNAGRLYACRANQDSRDML